jgi:hypothetical protein
MPTPSTAGTVPVTDTASLHPYISNRDVVRLALFFIIPIYTRIHILPSISSTLGHIYIAGSTGVCIVHFSRGNIPLDLVGDIVYGLLVSRLPSWGKLLLPAWIMPEIEGWRGEVVYWAFATRVLTYLLPEYYGRDVEVRCN